MPSWSMLRAASRYLHGGAVSAGTALLTVVLCKRR